jgi:pantoate--beta-alanine ligase
MTPTIIKTVADIQTWRKQLASETVGFVPTMGALHEGHLSLIKKSRNENQHTVLSIFVNPTQFNQAQDLAKYPRTWETDLQLAANEGTDVVFFPSYQEIYPDDYAFAVDENDFSRILCGASRAGHFKGVLTVVLKLINLIRPQKVYMGEKDYQQLQLIRKMTQALFLPTEIVGCPTLRNQDGLALSSRNSRLSESDIKKAAVIFKTITQSASADEARNVLEKSGFRIDYLVDIEKRRYVAAFLPSAAGDGEVRLIDNVER